jgi:hypothetical protein
LDGDGVSGMKHFDRMRVVFTLAGAWLFALSLKLLYFHSTTNGVIYLEGYNYALDYIPGIILGLIVLAHSLMRLKEWCLPRTRGKIGNEDS